MRPPRTPAGTAAAGEPASQSGVEAQRVATRGMRKVLGGGSVLEALGENGENARIAMLQKLEATDSTHGRGATVALEVEKNAIADVAAGASPAYVEAKYAISRGYVRHALQRRFGSPEAAQVALQGWVLENALACMVRTAEEIPNMSGPQAAVAGAILIDKSLALGKSIAERPKTIDFAALADMGRTLKVLREIAEKPMPPTPLTESLRGVIGTEGRIRDYPLRAN